MHHFLYIIIACSGTALILLRGGTRGAPINVTPLFCKKGIAKNYTFYGRSKNVAKLYV